MTARYAYTVRYRRRGWNYRQARYYRSERPARRFVETLLSGGRPDLAPIVECWIEREELGEPETVWRFRFEWAPMKPWNCDRCGAAGTTRDEVAVVFHRCSPPRRRTEHAQRRYILSPVETSAEEVRTEVWHGFAEAVGDEAMLRRATA